MEAIMDYSNAWYGGTSMKLFGKTVAGEATVAKLYSADLAITEGLSWTAKAKSSIGTNLDLVLTLSDGTTETVTGGVSSLVTCLGLQLVITPRGNGAGKFSFHLFPLTPILWVPEGQRGQDAEWQELPGTPPKLASCRGGGPGCPHRTLPRFP